MGSSLIFLFLKMKIKKIYVRCSAVCCMYCVPSTETYCEEAQKVTHGLFVKNAIKWNREVVNISSKLAISFNLILPHVEPRIPSLICYFRWQMNAKYTQRNKMSYNVSYRDIKTSSTHFHASPAESLYIWVLVKLLASDPLKHDVT